MSTKIKTLNEIEETHSPKMDDQQSLLDEYPTALLFVFIPVYFFVTQVLHPSIVDFIK